MLNKIENIEGYLRELSHESPEAHSYLMELLQVKSEVQSLMNDVTHFKSLIDNKNAFIETVEPK